MDERESSSSDFDPGQSLSWQNLLHALDNIQTFGDFSWADSYHRFVNPGLDIDGYGQVPLPLCPRAAQKIKQACRPAPFGKGDKTLIDDSVRKTWELDNTRFRIGNSHWQDFLDNHILARASQQLGLVGAHVKLHKLLLYEAGSFFKHHKDSQKEAGMVGTLVVCLPSEHDGGEVHLPFQEESRTYATGPASKFDMTALAWFGDVSHEVKELKSGYRLVLTYNIIVPTRESPQSASFFDTQVEKLKRILIKWRETERQRNRIYYPLEHQYSESSLSQGSLQGRDDAVCRVLHLAASAAGFSIFLATMTQHKKKGREDEDYDEDWTELEKMYTLQGHLISQEMLVRTHEKLSSALCYDTDDDADSIDQPEYRGNEDSPAHFRYHDTVVVVWVKSELHSLLGLDTGYLLVDALISEVVQDLNNQQDDEGTVTYAAHFMKECCESSNHRPKSTLPQIVEWSVKLDNRPLYETAVKVGFFQQGVQKALARLIEQDSSKRADPEGFGAKEWNEWLRPAFKVGQSLTDLHDLLNDFASEIVAHLEPSFRRWTTSTLMARFEKKAQLEERDLDFILAVMTDHHDDIEWVSTSILPSLCSRGTKELICEVLDKVFYRIDDSFTRDEARGIYKYILENNPSVFSPRMTESESLIFSELMTFVSLIKKSLCLDFSDHLVHIIKETQHQFQTATPSEKTTYMITKFLRDLVTVLKRQEQSETASKLPLKSFFKSILTKFFFRTAPSFPEEQFKGWAFPAQGCGKPSCSDCQELDEFLLSEERQTIRFKGSPLQRSHIRSRFEKDRLVDLKTEYEESGVGDIHTVVVTKAQTVFQRDLSLYESQIKDLKALVEPLKGDYLEKLLGNDLYQKLILLNSLGPSSDNMRRKRQAGERSDDVGKRTKRSINPAV